MWIWPFQLEIEGNVDRCESIAIWDGGIELRMKRRIPVGSHVCLSRETLDPEPPVDVRVERSWRYASGDFGVEGTFNGRGAEGDML